MRLLAGIIKPYKGLVRLSQGIMKLFKGPLSWYVRSSRSQITLAQGTLARTGQHKSCNIHVFSQCHISNFKNHCKCANLQAKTNSSSDYVKGSHIQHSTSLLTVIIQVAKFKLNSLIAYDIWGLQWDSTMAYQILLENTIEHHIFFVDVVHATTIAIWNCRLNPLCTHVWCVQAFHKRTAAPEVGAQRHIESEEAMIDGARYLTWQPRCERVP